MRLKSQIWVMAYIRRCAGEGVFAVVARRGQDEAGAIFIKVAWLNGTAVVFLPAPAGLAAAASERQWMSHGDGTPVSEKEADEYLRNQAEFDPDIWVIEVEDREGRHFMDDWLAEGQSIIP